MRRSEINQLQRLAVSFFADPGFRLPPFATWGPQDWQRAGPEVDQIRRCHLGWDLTDFGSGDFHAVGLLLFTVRNGNVHDDASDNYFIPPRGRFPGIEEDEAPLHLLCNEYPEAE